MPFIRETTRKPEETWCRQNRPIPSALKDKKIYVVDPIDDTCWAYMRLLKEHDRTKAVYPVDPYAEVYQFRDNVYGILTDNIDGMGDSWMYLTLGPEKAFLVDTSFGLGNLKGLVEELAGGREVIVADTHWHFDHAYGNAQFDKVYCHEYEAPQIERQDEHMWDYLFENGTGRGIWAEFDRGDLIPYKPYEIIGCPDGYTFNLGEDHEIELIYLGGHTGGHCGYLDRKNRIFFSGDDILSSGIGINPPEPGEPNARYATVRTLRDNLRRLVPRTDEFDAVFPGHFVTDLDSAVTASVLAACEAVCDDPVGNASLTESFPDGDHYERYVEGLGTLNYTLESVG